MLPLFSQTNFAITAFGKENYKPVFSLSLVVPPAGRYHAVINCVLVNDELQTYLNEQFRHETA